MTDPAPRRLSHSLAFADGSRWVISAGNEEASSIVSKLGFAMGLGGSGGGGGGDPSRRDTLRRLLVMIDAHNPQASPATVHVTEQTGEEGLVVCGLRPFPHGGGSYIQLLGLSSILARDAHARGGVLLHGALAEKDGVGVILAAPGGRGKSTASGRFRYPWRSLSDDATLVVADPEGGYRAHPWPTWSRFLDGGPCGTWDVQGAVPLGGIFFLAQALFDRAESVGPGRAVALLVESAEQALQFAGAGLGLEESRDLRLERFDNLCALVRALPAHILHISLTGLFWREIEHVLEGGHVEGAGGNDR